MTVPDFQSLMLPLLQLAGDGQEHTLNEAIDTLARQFRLTDADLRELLPSGKQSKYVVGERTSTGSGIPHTGDTALGHSPQALMPDPASAQRKSAAFPVWHPARSGW
jgi:Mrr restriction endonuclease-like protein